MGFKVLIMLGIVVVAVTTWDLLHMRKHHRMMKIVLSSDYADDKYSADKRARAALDRAKRERQWEPIALAAAAAAQRLGQLARELARRGK